MPNKGKMTSSDRNSSDRLDRIEALIASQEKRIANICDTVDQLCRNVSELTQTIYYDRQELRKLIDFINDKFEINQDNVNSVEVETEDGIETIYFGDYEIELTTNQLKKIYFKLITSKQPYARKLGTVFHCLISCITKISQEDLESEEICEELIDYTLSSFVELAKDIDYY